MFLASIEGNLIGLIIFAVIGVINWLAQRKQDTDAKRAKPARDERMAPTPEQDLRKASDEEERLRKFMEALGLPPNSQPPQRTEAKRPPFVSRPAEPPRVPQIKQSQAQQLRPPYATSSEPKPPPPPVLPRRLAEVPAEPTLPVEAQSLPPLRTRAVAEFDTVASHISAIPHEMAAAHAARDAYQERAPTHAAAQNSFVELLGSRDDLRRAVLLREVLGLPRGLCDGERLVGFR